MPKSYERRFLLDKSLRMGMSATERVELIRKLQQDFASRPGELELRDQLVELCTVIFAKLSHVSSSYLGYRIDESPKVRIALMAAMRSISQWSALNNVMSTPILDKLNLIEFRALAVMFTTTDIHQISNGFDRAMGLMNNVHAKCKVLGDLRRTCVMLAPLKTPEISRFCSTRATKAVSARTHQTAEDGKSLAEAALVLGKEFLVTSIIPSLGSSTCTLVAIRAFFDHFTSTKSSDEVVATAVREALRCIISKFRENPSIKVDSYDCLKLITEACHLDGLLAVDLIEVIRIKSNHQPLLEGSQFRLLLPLTEYVSKPELSESLRKCLSNFITNVVTTAITSDMGPKLQPPVNASRLKLTYCNCHRCRMVSDFLRHPSQMEFAGFGWTSNERVHVESILGRLNLNDAGLSVGRIRTRSPYQLSVTKTNSGYEGAMRAHQNKCTDIRNGLKVIGEPAKLKNVMGDRYEAIMALNIRVLKLQDLVTQSPATSNNIARALLAQVPQNLPMPPSVLGTKRPAADGHAPARLNNNAFGVVPPAAPQEDKVEIIDLSMDD